MEEDKTFDTDTADVNSAVDPDAESKKLNIKIDKLYNLSDVEYIRSRLNPSSQYEYAYILLDTNNIDPNLSTDTKFGWNLLNYAARLPGTISCVNNVKNIVAMRIFPVTSNLTAPVGETGKTYKNNVVNINNNFTFLIHEFQAQSHIGRDGRRFHFVLFPILMNPATALNPVTRETTRYTPTNPYIEFVTTGKGNGWFWFRTPIKEVSTITISMGNPFDLVKLSNTTRTLIPIQLIYIPDKTEK